MSIEYGEELVLSVQFHLHTSLRPNSVLARFTTKQHCLFQLSDLDHTKRVYRSEQKKDGDPESPPRHGGWQARHSRSPPSDPTARTTASSDQSLCGRYVHEPFVRLASYHPRAKLISPIPSTC